MRQILCLLLFFALCPALFATNPTDGEMDKVSAEIAALINTDLPIFLEVRAGEWTSALTSGIKRLLLQKGADVRERRVQDHLPAASIEDEEPIDFLLEDDQDLIDLAPYLLKTASLVSIDLDLQWQVVEHKSFLSYRSERKPMYVFNIKQVLLPQQKLQKVSTYTHHPISEQTPAYATTSIKWFEPMLVTAALASIIYLLWTTE